MDNKKERIFADGVIWKRPSEQTKEKAPWVKGHMSIKVTDFKNFMLKNQQGEWMNFDLKESQDKTKLYFELNTYQKERVEDNI